MSDLIIADSKIAKSENVAERLIAKSENVTERLIAKSENVAERFYTCPAGFTLMSSEELKQSNNISTDRPGGCYDANMTFAKPIFLGTPASCEPVAKFSNYCSYNPSEKVANTPAVVTAMTAGRIGANPTPAVVTAMTAGRIGDIIHNIDAI